MKRILLLAPVLAACAVLPGGGQDARNPGLDAWPQWRGPLHNGFCPHGDPPQKWDERTNVKWKVALPGRGSATPIVWGDQVFVLAAADTGREAAARDLPKVDPRFERKTKPPSRYHQFLVLSLDRRTGQELWRQVAAEAVPHEGHHPSHSYAAGSPVTDGQQLYVSFGSQGLFCYDLSGKLVWKHNLGRMYTRYGWGEASTPALHNDTVVVNWDHEGESFIVALDSRSGKVRWKKERDEPTSWATPLIVEHGGSAQVIVNAMKRVRSYDLATGELIWQCGGQTLNAIPSPVAYDGLAICMSGYRGSACYALPLDSRGDLTDTDKIAWKHNRGTPYVPSPLLMGGKLYFTQGNDPLLTCLDAKTGKVLLDRERLPGLDSLYASPVGVKDRIYVAGRDGTTLVLRHGERLETLATNKLDEQLDASPAVVGRELFLRGASHLYCIAGG